MEKEQRSVMAPDVKWMMEVNDDSPIVQDERSKELMLATFKVLQTVETTRSEDRPPWKLWEMWVEIPRGTIEDFGDYEEYLEDGEVSSREEFEELWLSYYPDSKYWFKLSFSEDGEYYSAAINDNLVMENVPGMEKEGWRIPDKSDIAQWMMSAVSKVVEDVRSGIYNEYVKQNLTYENRRGRITVEDMWSIFPETKAEFFKNITRKNIDRFISMMETEPQDPPEGRLPEMTAGIYFECCRLGYKANKYKGSNKLDGKELYRRHADGRDDGLLDLDPDSAEEFTAWYLDSKYRDGHVWEIIPGGSSFRAHMYVEKDDRGWWLSLSGRSYNRAVEMINFYLAMTDAGIPVYLYDSKKIVDVVTGKEPIGIVPEWRLPIYCNSLFPGEEITEYMNLPWEKREKFIAAAYWYPPEELRLL